MPKLNPATKEIMLAIIAIAFYWVITSFINVSHQMEDLLPLWYVSYGDPLMALISFVAWRLATRLDKNVSLPVGIALTVIWFGARLTSMFFSQGIQDLELNSVGKNIFALIQFVVPVLIIVFSTLLLMAEKQNNGDKHE
jgi:drug/metabolite transporter (DMT)-like permease